MNRLNHIGFGAIATLLLCGVLAQGCDNTIDIIDTTGNDDTTDDTAYQGARVRSPDVGWRTFVREVPSE